jgi:hypothetical protein
LQIRYTGAWKRGDTGLEAELGDGTINIAHGEDEIWQLLTFLNHEWPSVCKRWLKAHSDTKGTITVPWAEKVYRLPSRSRGPDHIVTVKGDRYSCTCEASMWGKECWAVQQVKFNRGGPGASTDQRDAG